jgi:hypothetical protein
MPASQPADIATRWKRGKNWIRNAGGSGKGARFHAPIMNELADKERV